MAERWILARLRNETFFSLAALNVRIRALLVDLNARTMRAYGASRQELFERLDRPALKPLPAERFVHAEWKSARVNLDYHVELDRHYYSVPHALVHEQVELRFTAATVEVFLRGQRVAAHARSTERGRHTTIAAHMPKAHQKHLAWTPSRLVHWADEHRARHPEAGRGDPRRSPAPRAGLPLVPRHPAPRQALRPERLEAACTRAVAARARSYRHVDSILKRGLDRVPLPATGARRTPASHENVRGADYYQLPNRTKETCMLNEPTMEKLMTLRLNALAAAWTEQQRSPDSSSLCFDERLALLVDAEWLDRQNKRLGRALREAKLRLANACIEDLDYPARRQLDRAVVRQLATCAWVEQHHNVVITGPTGVGKTYLACALAQQACRKGYRALYRRVPRLFDELTLARADGTYPRLLARLARIDVLVLDDWGIAPLGRPRAPRSARDHRRPPRPPLHDPHQPDPRREVARPSRRPHRRRRHLRSPAPQRPPARATRAFAKEGIARERLNHPASLRSVHDPRSECSR